MSKHTPNLTILILLLVRDTHLPDNVSAERFVFPSGIQECLDKVQASFKESSASLGAVVLYAYSIPVFKVFGNVPGHARSSLYSTSFGPVLV